MSQVLFGAKRIAFQFARGEEFEMAEFAFRERRRFANVPQYCQAPDSHVGILSHLRTLRSRAQVYS